MKKYLLFDIESKPTNDIFYTTQLSYIICDKDHNTIKTFDKYTKDNDIKDILEEFDNDISKCDLLLSYNLKADIQTIENEGIDMPNLKKINKQCIMIMTMILLKQPHYINLELTHYILSNKYVEQRHEALSDVYLTKYCYVELLKIKAKHAKYIKKKFNGHISMKSVNKLLDLILLHEKNLILISPNIKPASIYYKIKPIREQLNMKSNDYNNMIMLSTLFYNYKLLQVYNTNTEYYNSLERIINDKSIFSQWVYIDLMTSQPS